MITLNDIDTKSLESYIDNVLYNKFDAPLSYIEKIDAIEAIMKRYGFMQIGQGTNRSAFSRPDIDIVLKVPFHKGGVWDNGDEYALSQDPFLGQYVTKSINLSPNKLLLEMEKVKVCNLEDWEYIRPALVGRIVPELTTKYIVGDLTHDNARTNIGLNDYNEIRILDYAYFVDKESPFNVCDQCGSRLNLIRGSEILNCPQCNNQCDVNHIVDKIRSQSVTTSSNITNPYTLDRYINMM